MLAVLALVVGPVKLAINAPVGAKYVMNLTFQMKGIGGGGWMKVDSVVTETLTKKEGANNWWKTKYAITKTTGEGQLLQAAGQMAELGKYDMSFLRSPQNHVMKAKVNGMDVGPEAFKGNSDVTFPDKAVNAGATWKGAMDLGGNLVVVIYKFVGPKTYGGKATYLITGTVNEPSIKTTKAYSYYVEKGSCKTLYAEGAARATVQGKTLDISFTMKRKS